MIKILIIMFLFLIMGCASLEKEGVTQCCATSFDVCMDYCIQTDIYHESDLWWNCEKERIITCERYLDYNDTRYEYMDDWERQREYRDCEDYNYEICEDIIQGKINQICFEYCAGE